MKTKTMRILALILLIAGLVLCTISLVSGNGVALPIFGIVVALISFVLLILSR